MSLIPPQLKSARQTINLRMTVESVATLREYAEFIDSTQDHVVQQALRFVFERDKTFRAWRARKQTGNAPASTMSPESIRSHRASDAGR